MSGFRRTVLTAALLGGALLAAVAPVQAHIGFCQIVSVTVPQGGFTVTPLDNFAFTTVPAPPAMTTVREFVCPSFFAPPLIVAPPVFFVEQPAVEQPAAPVPVSEPSVEEAPAPVAAMPAVVAPVTVRDLAQDPGQYDRQVVSLVGDAAALRTSRDARGALYTEIRLEEGGASVVTIAWGTPALQAGQRVRVTGNFYARAPFALGPGTPPQNVFEADVINVLP